MPSKPFTSLTDLVPQEADLAHLRHELHRNPELAFAENETSDLVAEQLQAYGYQVHRGIAKTGVVGTLTVGEGGRSIGIRADFDALPICEANTFAYASKNPGKMHACGHDGHTAMLLGAARHLAQTRRFNGTVNLIFQPAEERGFDSGAKQMIAEGLFERFPCDAVFALHNHPGRPAGTFMFRSGAFMAAGDRVLIKLVGQGGHAARPHLAHDPIVAAASIVMGLQTIVSRNIDPTKAAVITVGKFTGGDAPNVIPDQVELRLSVRSFSPEVRVLLKERIIALVTSQARSFEVEAVIDYVEGYPVVSNTDEETRFAIEVARELVGPDAVDDNMDMLMGSEDFAYMLQARLGCFLRIGNGPADQGRALHSPHYDFNNQNLSVGAAYWSRLVERYLDPGRLTTRQ